MLELELKNIKKVFNAGTVSESTLFENFNLSVEKNEFVSIIGSNGSGKTTMLNLICGSYSADAGDIIIAGEKVNSVKEFNRYRRMGRVYQDPAMGTCPNMTMLENLSLADHKGQRFGLSGGVNKKREEYYREQLAFLGLGLEDKMDVKLGLLSGGQRQAVALIMATLTPIDFLILDEHTAALDPKTAEVIMELTDRVIKEKKLTALMVTHNLRYAVEYGSRLIMMDRGHIVLDKSGDEKRSMKIDDVLSLFNAISIECGN